jgi:hypothetical protein
LKIGRCYRVPAAALRRALQIETENDESA